MRQSKRSSILFSAVFLLCIMLVFTACGSGGGSGGGSKGGASLVSITPDNAAGIAGQVNESQSSVSQASKTGGTGGGIFGLVRQNPDSPEKGIGIVELVAWQIKKISDNKEAVSQAPLAGASQSINAPCDGAGSMDITVTYKDPKAVSAGDTIKITYNNCRIAAEGGTGTANGTMTMKFNSGADMKANPVHLDVTCTFSSLQFNLPDDNCTINGTMKINMSVNTYNDDISGNVSGSSLSVSYGPDDVRTIKNYTMDITIDGGTEDYSYTYNGTLDSSHTLGGSVSFNTTTRFEGYGSDYPHKGVMLISGANNTSVTLKVIDNSQVTLDIDADGDGTAETTLTKSWAEVDI